MKLIISEDYKHMSVSKVMAINSINQAHMSTDIDVEIRELQDAMWHLNNEIIQLRERTE